MIEIKNVTKTYSDFTALNDVSLTVNTGEIYCLVGPNGSGKSTILNLITGVLVPDTGDILYDGKAVYENESVKRRIAYVTDSTEYLGNSTLNEMAKFYKRLYDFDDERFEKLKASFSSINPNKRIKTMSKGMQKQVAIILGLTYKSDYIILDEPLDGLDPFMRKQVWSIISQIVAEYKTTAIISSHNLRELEDMCDTVAIIDKGNVILEQNLVEVEAATKKIQIAFGKQEIPKYIADEKKCTVKASDGEFEIKNISKNGNVFTVIVKGDTELIKTELEKHNPVLMEILPLSLEEIFVYEIGGENYGVKDIVF